MLRAADVFAARYAFDILMLLPLRFAGYAAFAIFAAAIIFALMLYLLFSPLTITCRHAALRALP